MFSETQIRLLIKEEYGIICGKIKQLHGYVDKNYYLQEQTTRKEYVLRITPEENYMKSRFNYRSTNFYA